MKYLRYVPNMLTSSRLLLAPILCYVALVMGNHAVTLLLLACVALTDLFDGILARRLGVSSPQNAVFDSVTDTWFFTWLAFTLWLSESQRILPFLHPLSLLILLQFSSWTFDLIKYKRTASFHATLAKLWGYSLYPAAASLITGWQTPFFVWLMIGCGVASNIEGFAIKITLPVWTSDIKNVKHARTLRSQWQEASDKTIPKV